MTEALGADRTAAIYHIVLGEVHSAAGNRGSAEGAFARALALEPRSASALISYGQFQLAGGDSCSALKTLGRAVTIDPKSAQAHLALAHAQRAAGRGAMARASAERAAALDPTGSDALLLAAQLLSGEGKYSDSIDYLGRALSADPRNAAAYVELGSISLTMNRPADAASFFRDALSIDEASAQAHTGLGLALRLLGREKDAAASLTYSAALDPALVQTHVGLALLANSGGRIQDALVHFTDALRLAPDDAATHFNRALALLRHARFAEGWEEFDWRWKTTMFKTPLRHKNIPRWTGSSLVGQHIIVWGEQGVGDEILFSTMIPDVIAANTTLTIECDPRLVPLFRRSWPHASIVAGGATIRDRSITLQAASGDLGKLLRPNLASFPRRKQILAPDPDLAAALRRRLLEGSEELLIGISWASHSPLMAAHKSTSLTDWEPLLKQKGARFVDLQYGDTADDRAKLKERTGLSLLHAEGIDLTEDLDGLAALIAACDLVISVSNTTVHLAGAVGIPVWVLTPPPVAQPWYWLDAGEESPWYESVRLFRPGEGEGLNDLIKRAATALRSKLAPLRKKRFGWF